MSCYFKRIIGVDAFTQYFEIFTIRFRFTLSRAILIETTIFSVYYVSAVNYVIERITTYKFAVERYRFPAVSELSSRKYFYFSGVLAPQPRYLIHIGSDIENHVGFPEKIAVVIEMIGKTDGFMSERQCFFYITFHTFFPVMRKIGMNMQIYEI